ncbi:uncharacterized protein O3C94_021111 [Discoglossus pictus]
MAAPQSGHRFSLPSYTRRSLRSKAEVNEEDGLNSDKVTPSVLSESDQEEETNMRIPRDIKEEEIPVNISDNSDKVTPSDLSESDQEKETNKRSPREIKEEEIPVDISEGPLDVRPPIVSKIEQEDLNIRDQQQVKEEESHGDIREGLALSSSGDHRQRRRT